MIKKTKKQLKMEQDVKWGWFWLFVIILYFANSIGDALSIALWFIFAAIVFAVLGGGKGMLRIRL